MNVVRGTSDPDFQNLETMNQKSSMPGAPAPDFRNWDRRCASLLYLDSCGSFPPRSFMAFSRQCSLPPRPCARSRIPFAGWTSTPRRTGMWWRGSRARWPSKIGRRYARSACSMTRRWSLLHCAPRRNRSLPRTPSPFGASR